MKSRDRLGQFAQSHSAAGQDPGSHDDKDKRNRFLKCVDVVTIALCHHNYCATAVDHKSVTAMLLHLQRCRNVSEFYQLSAIIVIRFSLKHAGCGIPFLR